MQVFHNPEQAAVWLRSRGVKELVGDSRRLSPGEGFIAWPGLARDARHFVSSALQAGAGACLVESDGAEVFAFDGERVAAYAGLKHGAGEVAHHFYGRPSEALRLVAVTGTNGKTSTSWWLAQWLSALGEPCALVGTLGMGWPSKGLVGTGLTTPDPIGLQRGFRAFVDEGARACALEASSIGLQEGRLNGAVIDTAVFTNLSQDHLDYHGDMASYWQAKRALFGWPGLRVAVVNVDDARGVELAAELLPKHQRGELDLWTVSVRDRTARLCVTEWGWSAQGLRFEAVDDTGATASVSVPLVGEYNLSNLLCAMAVLRAWGHALNAIVAASQSLTPVPGRMQPALRGETDNGPLVLVDYAHTPDALEKALQALRPLATQRKGRLWCLVGCGGDRDRGKRPLMAAVAEREADHVVLTSDNPRSEDPVAILEQMRAGLVSAGPVRVVPERAQAIADAVMAADECDIVLLAGKGHEDYQEVAGVRHAFSDLEQGRLALRQRHERRPEKMA